MADLAKYVRIYDPSPDDDLVSKREAAVKDAVAALRKTTNPAALVALGGAAAKSFETGIAPEPLGSIVATAIKNKAPSFIREERELEVAVISAAAVMDMFELADTGNTVMNKDVVASTLWSALSFQGQIEDPKHEQLRQDLLALARDRSLARAESSRKRSIPKELPTFAEGDVAQIGKSLAAASSTIAALTANATLDREETNILWWSHGGRSPTTGEMYEGLEPVVRGVVRGIELGILVRRLPSQSMRSLALSGVPTTEPLTLAQVIQSADSVLEKLRLRIPGTATIEAHPVVFPLLSSILSGAATAEGVAKSGDEWCSRAVLEAGIASICETPNSRI